jgi:subtilisin family serine protease
MKHLGSILAIVVVLSLVDPGLVNSQTIRDVVISRETAPTSAPSVSGTRTSNINARRSHFVEELQGEFIDLDGRDVVAAVFDDGPIRWTHKEFRIIQNDPSSSRIKFRTGTAATAGFTKHATHVAGTIGAAGIPPRERVRGMAPAIKTIYSEDMYNDLNNLEILAPHINVSNHSYGPPSGWEEDTRDGSWFWCGDESVDPAEDSKFGKYGDQSARLDSIIYGSKKLLSFVAAGNHRTDIPPSFIQTGTYSVCGSRDLMGEITLKPTDGRVTKKTDGFDHGGLDTISGLCIAKNAICIGAIGDPPPQTSGTAVGPVESYSSWGPTDDGRIKPDLVANGHLLVSTSDVDDEAIVSLQGTSMASPTAAGIASLLVQLYRRERGEDPFSAVIKAVLIHTAMDAGERGPDPIYGWGSINALMAGRVIGQKQNQDFRHLIGRFAVSNNSPAWRLSLEPTNDPIKVTVVWVDPPGAANREPLDDASPALQNDLDIKLIAPDGTVFLPYSLDRTNPLAPAKTTSPNRVDNVEVIENVGSLAGQWTLEVSINRLGIGQQQDFAVVVSGLRRL